MATVAPRIIAIGCALAALAATAWVMLAPCSEDRDGNAELVELRSFERAPAQDGAEPDASASPLRGAKSPSSAEPADVTISRTTVETPSWYRPDLTPAVIERLNQFDEDVEDYDVYRSQSADTGRILLGHASYRLHEALRPGRFSVDAYIDSTLKPRYRLSAAAGAKVREILGPLCDELVAERRRAWAAAGLKGGGRLSYTHLAARDLAARREWLELEAKYAERILAADARLRKLLGVRGSVIDS